MRQNVVLCGNGLTIGCCYLYHPQVNLVIDGWQSHSFILDYPFSAVKCRHKSASKPQPVLCIGQAEEDLTLSMHGHLCLGNLCLFKGICTYSLNLFILLRLRNKLLQLVLILLAGNYTSTAARYVGQ